MIYLQINSTRRLEKGEIYLITLHLLISTRFVVDGFVKFTFHTIVRKSFFLTINQVFFWGYKSH